MIHAIWESIITYLKKRKIIENVLGVTLLELEYSGKQPLFSDAEVVECGM